MGNFERARNEKPFRWAGDPERWGGATNTPFVALVTSNPQFTNGPQLLRAQTQELIALGWDLVATWELSGVDSTTDTGFLGLEVTIGTGQASSTLVWNLTNWSVGSPPTQQNAGAVSFDWFPLQTPLPAQTFRGVAFSGAPIIACSINARPVLKAQHAGGGADHTITAVVTAHCAPRSWVP